jgi:hypothetical protein
MSDEAVLHRLREELDLIQQLALSCPAGGDERWDQRLRVLGVTPLSAEERAAHLREGPGQSRGALLLELRWALDAAGAPWRPRLDDEWRVRDLVEELVRAYVTSTRPRVSTSSIFANAMAGITTSPGRITGTAATAADRCGCCGATLVDRSKPTCRYCGEPL